ncbi:TPA: anaerobic C4-dicarboxylate transporter, partial [Campylobacter lari]|nr:anaerobic C4-dicarboxylate transporter [Campylobacter lari]
LAIGIFSWFRGKDLDKDEEFQARIKDPEQREYIYGDSKTLLGQQLPTIQWVAMWIFLGAIAIVAILGAFPELRPQFTSKGVTKPMNMVATIQMFMLLAGAALIIFTKLDASKIAKNEIFKSGMIALVAVFGISWMADTMFAVHTPMMKESLGNIVIEHPWTYAVMLLLISKFVNSQAAAIAAFVPLALGIGVEPGIIIAFAAACYGYYILPTYPSDLATIQFDRSGTTKIGKFVINHSFILPGLIGVIVSCIVGYFLALGAGYL